MQLQVDGMTQLLCISQITTRMLTTPCPRSTYEPDLTCFSRGIPCDRKKKEPRHLFCGGPICYTQEISRIPIHMRKSIDNLSKYYAHDTKGHSEQEATVSERISCARCKGTRMMQKREHEKKWYCGSCWCTKCQIPYAISDEKYTVECNH